MNVAVSGATIDKPWKLEFKPASGDSQLRFSKAANGVINSSQQRSDSTAANLIQEVEISQNEFTRLLSLAEQEKPVTVPSSRGSRIFGLRIKKIGDLIKRAVLVVVGVVKDIVHVIVKPAEGIIDLSLKR